MQLLVVWPNADLVLYTLVFLGVKKFCWHWDQLNG